MAKIQKRFEISLHLRTGDKPKDLQEVTVLLLKARGLLKVLCL